MKGFRQSTVIIMASGAQKKRNDSVSLKTFRRWSFSDDFIIEMDAEDQVFCSFSSALIFEIFFRHCLSDSSYLIRQLVK